MKHEINYLRELAKKHIEIAHLPVMEERTSLWYRHNEVKAERPIVLVEMASFASDLLPELQCENDLTRQIEHELQTHITHYERIGDDKVVPKTFSIPLHIGVKIFDLEQKRTFANDSTGKPLGWKDEHFIQDLEKDFPKLRHSTISYDRVKTEEYKAFAEEVLDGLMPVQLRNRSLDWLGISNRIIDLMGMESLMFAMIDTPELVKELYDFVCDDIIYILRTMENMNLLTPNNGNDYAGAGSYGFTDELKSEGKITSDMLWGNLNSQETVTISAEMFGEFAFPAYMRLSEEFGLSYYGCCEPVHSIWKDYISKLHGLRKVSVSPWCDEEYMGDALRGGKVIYSRKPRPDFLGVKNFFDENRYKEHITNTLKAAKGCGLEIIHRDVYTLSGDLDKPKRAVKIIRKLIDEIW